MATDLVARLSTWLSQEAICGCGPLMREAMDEIERLQAECNCWSSVAATRNVNIALIAEQRDHAIERVQDLQNLLGEWLQWFANVNEIGSRTKRALDVPDTRCGTCDEPHVEGAYYNHNFVPRAADTRRD